MTSPRVLSIFIVASRTAIPALLAERAASREIMRTVAAGLTLVYSDLSDAYYCALCSAELPVPPDVDLFGDWTRVGWREQHIQHAADCLVTKARTLLADNGKDDES